MSFAISNTVYKCQGGLGPSQKNTSNQITAAIDLCLIASAVILSGCLFGLPAHVGTIGHYVAWTSVAVGSGILLADIIAAILIKGFQRGPKNETHSFVHGQQVGVNYEENEETRFPKNSENSNGFQRLGSHIGYLFDSTLQSSSFQPKNEAFGDELDFTTANHGKKEDIPYFHNDFSSPEFVNYAKKRGFIMEESIKLKPFGMNGACAGACMYFCKDWLQTQNFNYLADKYKDGAPYEAVALQACFKSLKHKYVYYAPLYQHLSEMFSLLYKKKKVLSSDDFNKICTTLKQKAIENTDLTKFLECVWIVNATEKFLIEDRPIGEYLAFVKNMLQQEHAYTLEVGYAHNSLWQICQDYKVEDKETMHQIKKAWTIDVIATACGFIGLDIETKFFGDSFSEIVESDPSTWNLGTYFFVTPIFSSKGKYEGAHASALIKASDSVFYLYDPNRGGKQITNPKDTLTKLFKHYSGAMPQTMTSDDNSLDFIAGRFFQVYQLFKTAV